MKTYTTEVEINEVDTKIEVDYEMYFGQAEINCITNLENGEVIRPDIDGSMTAIAVIALYEELYEWAQTEDQISLENHYQNV